MTIRGIGVDVADVDRFRALYRRHGDRFARKWFAVEEISRCRQHSDPGALLAEHFAVKEAVWKALGPGAWAGPLPWRSIVFHADGGAVSLHGRVETLAGAVEVHSSVVRTGRVAVATALVSAAATSITTGS